MHVKKYVQPAIILMVALFVTYNVAYVVFSLHPWDRSYNCGGSAWSFERPAGGLMQIGEAIQLYQLDCGMWPPGKPNVWVERRKRESRLEGIFYPCIRFEHLIGSRDYLYWPDGKGICLE